MPHHRARFTARGRWDVVRRVVEDGETFAQAAAWANVLEVDRLGVGASLAQASAGGAGVAGVSGRALQPPAPLAGAGAGRGGRADLRAARADRMEPAPARRRARDRPAALDRPPGAAARRRARAARGPSARRSSATSGRAPASCCTWTSRSFGKFTEPGHARHRRPHPALAAGRLGVRATRSSTTARRLAYSELHDDERAATVTAFTRRALDFFLEHGDRRRATDDRQRVRLHPEQLPARAAARPRDPITSAPGPTRRAPTARSSATSRPCNANGPTRSNTPQATPVEPRCHTGCATTTSGAPTAPSATDPPHRVREVTGLDS